MSVKFTDNSDEILRMMETAKQGALEAIGARAEHYAKEEITKFPAVDTGRLRRSIAHAVRGDDVYIGTNVEYAKWIEYGTGIYASDGQGRKNPWKFTDKNGVEHCTRGVRPVRYLKKAATGHSEEYREIWRRICEDG